MNGKKKKPEIVVFAGPNGSGKSTITTILRPVEMDYINADDIQRILHCDTLSAAKLAEQQREEHLSNGRDFCFGVNLKFRVNFFCDANRAKLICGGSRGIRLPPF